MTDCSDTVSEVSNVLVNQQLHVLADEVANAIPPNLARPTYDVDKSLPEEQGRPKLVTHSQR